MFKQKLLAFALGLCCAPVAYAFCGFYVAKADSRLYNHASQVVLARDGDRTVITMVNDFKGDPKAFAVVVPVPTFLERGQIHVGDKAVIDHLDAYSAPRLVEYFDEDPCRVVALEDRAAPAAAMSGMASKARNEALGVKVEAQYTVGEYDIVILSAEQSEGLATWLKDNGYHIPPGADAVLGSYIKQGLHFFVAKVNLKEQARLGFRYLRPLQVAYESPKFVLPIRLGTLNADGPQELYLYTLTRKGRVETTNYRTVKLPSGMDVPLYVKSVFGDFYRALFDQQVNQNDMRTVFLEYAWDMNACDPCAAAPLSMDELRSLGVFWLDDDAPRQGIYNEKKQLLVPPRQEVFLTRLHLRYDAAHFPEDLVLQETADRQNFQARYVLRHPWTSDSACAAAETYRRQLPARFEREAQQLASLTGWEISAIRAKMNATGEPVGVDHGAGDKWWKRLWKD